METTISYRSARSLDGQEQSAKLSSFFPTFRQVARGNPFIWEGTLRPNGATTYRVRIKYLHGRRPVVTVLEPKLVSISPDVLIPHTFASGAICLHLIDEWNGSMWLHETIVPWASLWLYYYEMWHATGEWLGGGHVAVSKDDEGSQRPAELGETG